MPIEAQLLDGLPVELERCPSCGAEPFDPFLRGQIQRSPWPWWAQLLPLARWRRPYCALICWACKDIVGYE